MYEAKVVQREGKLFYCKRRRLAQTWPPERYKLLVVYFIPTTITAYSMKSDAC